MIARACSLSEVGTDPQHASLLEQSGCNCAAFRDARTRTNGVCTPSRFTTV